MGSCGWFGLKVRKIGVMWWFWGESEGNWGSEVVFGVKQRENWGPEVVLGVKLRENGVLWLVWVEIEGKLGS